MTRADRGIVLERWLRELPHRDREMLRLRFEEDLTQREIAERFGISQMPRDCRGSGEDFVQ